MNGEGASEMVRMVVVIDFHPQTGAYYAQSLSPHRSCNHVFGGMENGMPTRALVTLAQKIHESENHYREVPD